MFDISMGMHSFLLVQNMDISMKAISMRSDTHASVMGIG